MSTRALLAQLPLLPSADPHNEIVTLLHKFKRDLELHVKGVSDADESDFEDEMGLIQAIRPAGALPYGDSRDSVSARLSVAVWGRDTSALLRFGKLKKKFSST